MKNFSKKNKKGFSLPEIIVVVAILAIVMIAVGAFEQKVFVYKNSAQTSIARTYDARAILKTMVKELRSVESSNTGAYAIEQAGTSTLVFFSDTTGTGVRERIKYFVSSSTLKRSSIIPTGSPLSYSTSSEKITTLANNLDNDASSPLFEYYDGTYTGTSSALAQPVNANVIRLVKINLKIKGDARTSTSTTYISDVTLRNLKDNL